VPRFDQLIHRNTAYLAVTSLIGLVAFVGGLLMLLTSSGSWLGVVMGAMGVLWLIATVHHVLLAREAPPSPGAGAPRARVRGQPSPHDGPRGLLRAWPPLARTRRGGTLRGADLALRGDQVMAADQQPEPVGAEQGRPAGAEQVRLPEGDAVTWVLAVVAGAVGALAAAGLGSTVTDGRHTGTTAALGGVLAFVTVMSLRRWGSRTWFCLWLLAFGAYFSTLGMAGWARLGYVAIVTGLLLSAAFDATPRTLRVTAGAALIVTAGLLMRIGLENTDDASIDVFGAVDDGAEALVSDAASLIVDGDVDIELGLVEWVALAVLLGLAYRMLEIASGARLVGPVTV
jgi:hypothetical protein